MDNLLTSTSCPIKYTITFQHMIKIPSLRLKKSKGILVTGPPLWSIGQCSWLQTRRPGFDSRHCQKNKVVGLERCPLSLVSTTEELLDRKVAAPV
jgi:hypothetical protein